MTVALSQQYVGRFAPSPTGPLHFGSLIAALASYADAKASSGLWLLRIEDLDPPREVAGSADVIVRSLAQYGFRWDGPILRQSTREAAYAAALAELEVHGLVYQCACTRLELRRGAQGVGGERVYPGTCRAGVPRGRQGRSLRLRVTHEPIDFVDRIQGPQRQILADDIGDFVVRRADRRWAYQLAVVVDDAAQGITDVVRGADLLASTPRQIWLQGRLGMPLPRYAHVPVALDTGGQKLSKQTDAAPLPEDDPVGALLAAWRFLDQAEPGRGFDSVNAFWDWSIPHWNARRVPPVQGLPAKTALPVGL